MRQVLAAYFEVDGVKNGGIATIGLHKTALTN